MSIQRLNINSELASVPWLIWTDEDVELHLTNEHWIPTETLLSYGVYKKGMVDKLVRSMDEHPVAAFHSVTDFSNWLSSL